MPTHNRLILLVEDDPDDAYLIVRTFGKANPLNKVVVVGDGVLALDFLFAQGAYADRAAATPPALVLLDLKLPRMGGFEVLRAMRENEKTKFIPVVVITSSKEESDSVKSFDLGANRFLQKSANFANFAQAIQTLGLYWLVLEKPEPEAPK